MAVVVTAAVTDVDICNRALALLGQNSITALSDNTAEAILCNRFFASSRDAALAEHNWNFAKVQHDLVSTGNTPEHTWSFEYSLPTDIVRIVAPHVITDDYEVVGNKILANVSDMEITYIKQVTDVGEWPALFQEAVVHKLAAFLAPVLRQDPGVTQQHNELFRAAIVRAKIWDAQEQSTKAINADDLLDVRNI